MIMQAPAVAQLKVSTPPVNVTGHADRPSARFRRKSIEIDEMEFIQVKFDNNMVIFV